MTNTTVDHGNSMRSRRRPRLIRKLTSSYVVWLLTLWSGCWSVSTTWIPFGLRLIPTVALLLPVSGQQPQSIPQPLPQPQLLPQKLDNHQLPKKGGNIQSSKRVGTFDKDSRDDCYKLLEHCHNELFVHIYIQCAASCTKYLEREGMKGTAKDPDSFYDMSFRTIDGRKRISTERFEGYVTVVAIVPLTGGMSAYYNEMLEHLHSIFKPQMEATIIPVDVGLGLHIRQSKNPKVVVLEEETAPETHPLIKWLLAVTPRSGAGLKDHNDMLVQTLLDTDRVNIFIVSADAKYVERLISPSLSTLQQKVSVYRKTLTYEL